MNVDHLIVGGVICAALAVLSLINAFTESRFPRGAIGLGTIAAVLFVLALRRSPTGFAIEEIPRAFVRVFGPLLN
jgi:hypothetical protein